MFCSKCGKTLAPEALQCPACGHPVGESRFEGSPYTSAQAHIQPGSGAHAPVMQAYTRANYTSMGEAAVEGDADARTTYRPVYEGASAPEEIRREMKDAIRGAEEDDGETHAETPYEELSEEARETIDAMDRQLKLDDVDMSKFRSRPIKSAGQTGISSDVSEFIQKLEADQAKRPVRHRPEDYGEYEDAPDGAESAAGNGQAEVFDDIDEEEFDELRHSSFGVKNILKVAVALVVVAALFVGGVMWFRYIRGNTSNSPIENVSEELYASGVELIKAHAAEEHVASVLSAYTAEDGGLAALSTKLVESAAEVDALLPAEATENEQLFIDALNAIEDNIANCITADALAVGQNDAEAIAQSDERWQVVNDAIALLEQADSSVSLTGIINGEQVDVPEAEATPTPTPAVNYDTLAKGAKSDAVLDMQNRLYELGFFLEERDGNFGSKTQTAVKMFQQAAGLAITGIADSETQNAMYAEDAPRTEYAQPTPTPKPAETPEPAATEPPADTQAEGV